jgi:hypothetical protein
VLHVALGDIFHHKQRAVAVHTGTGLVYFIYLNDIFYFEHFISALFAFLF